MVEALLVLERGRVELLMGDADVEAPLVFCHILHVYHVRRSHLQYFGVSSCELAIILPGLGITWMMVPREINGHGFLIRDHMRHYTKLKETPYVHYSSPKP